MHWAPIPIAELALPPTTSDFAITQDDIYRRLTRAPRRGFWLTAIAMIVFIAIAFVSGSIGRILVGGSFFAFAVLAGTCHIMIRHKLNVAIWISHEPAAVYWAQPGHFIQKLGGISRSMDSLTLHTPASVRFEVTMPRDDLLAVLQWLRQRNPAVLIGYYSPDDSDGQLSGSDPWSHPNTLATVASTSQAPGRAFKFQNWPSEG
jgi:hypothetical protein